ncbi:unnamed protein product [Prorocentrum cordatum]|uniref:Uncharacterized protein n=1 Tax=Prorocentrum cordatum TaxID=2364126 RepID=A0ABN9QJQ9_9DINO|nr:unnamed protein product [Polarella glacialis]
MVSCALLLVVLAAVAPGTSARYAVPAATAMEVNAHGRPLVFAERGQGVPEQADTTEEPAELVQADTTEEPAELVEAGTTEEPTELVHEDSTEEPTELIQAGTTEEPAELVQADTTEEPAELVQADTTEEPAELVQADTTEEPAELVQADTNEERTPQRNPQNWSRRTPPRNLQSLSRRTQPRKPAELVQADITEEPAELVQADTTEEPAELVQADTTEEPTELVQEDTPDERMSDGLLDVTKDYGRSTPQGRISNRRLAAATTAIAKIQSLIAFAKNISDQAETMISQDGYLSKDVKDSLSHVGLNMKLFKDGMSMVPNQDRLLLKVKELEATSTALETPLATLGSV